MKNLVSCLCVTKNHFPLLKRAVDCYHEQTYPNKELIILCEDNNPSLSQIKQLGEAPDITVIVQSTNPKLTLGELRNISIKQSSGEYFCQWDDDDWYHPDRIQKQYDFVIESGASGCYLDQRIIYDAPAEQLYRSNPCKFEGSVLMRKDVAMNTNMYSSRNTAEDTDFIFPLIDNGALKSIHAPHLYVYIYHGDNAWEREHFEEIFEASQKIIYEELRKKLLLESEPATISGGNKIPKIIHQTWKSQEALSQAHKDYQNHNKKLMPSHNGWTYRFVDDDGCRPDIENFRPDLLDVYDNYPLDIQRYDLWRVVVVEHYGGFYADVDVRFNNPFDELLDHSCVLAQEDPQHKAFIGNYVFGATPYHPFITAVLTKMKQKALQIPTVQEAEDIFKTTGPTLWREAYKEYLAQPEPSAKSLHVLECPPEAGVSTHFGTFAQHYAHGSWRGSQFKNDWGQKNSIPLAGKVPKIFHQIWMGWDLPEPPPSAKVCRQTWEEHHPDWSFRLWGPEECEALIANEYPWFLEKYNSYQIPIKKADAARYFILHKFGGVYIDHDYVCVKNISSIFEDAPEGSCFLPLEPSVNSKKWWAKHKNWDMSATDSEGFLISNAMMASEPGCIFWETVHMYMLDIPKKYILRQEQLHKIDVMETTGPAMLTRAYFKHTHKEEINLIPSKLLQPISTDEGNSLFGIEAWKKETIARKAYAAHLWNCSTSEATGGVEGMTLWSKQKEDKIK